MKKHYILLATVCALIACDPVEEDGSFDAIATTPEAVKEGFSFQQLDKEGKPAADGNYFTYVTSPATEVTVYNYKADGSENILSHGTSGSFQISPSRGSDPNQEFHVRVYNTDGTKAEFTQTVNVYVKAELTVAERLFCSESGRKTYKWDFQVDSLDADGNVYYTPVWGNMGYCGGSGADVYNSYSGKWWGVTGNEEDNSFSNQLKHAVGGQLTGEEDMNAYMVFTEDGVIEKYDGNGSKLNETTYEIVEMTENTDWAPYRLKTGENSVLWPYEINAGGKYVTEYEVVYISTQAMVLVYPDKGEFGKLGDWSEATWWRFKSSDADGSLVGVDRAGKKWGWNLEKSARWGNMGYCGGNGADVFTAESGKWWGCATAEEFADQVKHAVGGALTGDEQDGAYFELLPSGDIKKYDGAGNLLNTTTWKMNTERGDGTWCVGHLETGDNSVLWPYEINAGGKYVTDFEVVYLDDNHMTLVYPDGGAFDGLGGWGEASFWQFKIKE